MTHTSSLLFLFAPLLPAGAIFAPAGEFVPALEKCITDTASMIAETSPQWRNRCQPAAEKTAFQSKQLDKTIGPLYRAHGYAAGLWCALYTAQMLGSSHYRPYTDWYERLLCPWDLKACGHEALGFHGDERFGVPLEWAGSRGDRRHGEEQRTMSCGLCNHLFLKFGKPPYEAQRPAMSAGEEHKLATMRNAGGGWWYEWDIHAFGVWLANEARLHSHAADEIMQLITKFRVTDGEEIHGFVWQATAQVGSGVSMVEQHAINLCAPTWHKKSPQTRWDCAHAVGHGFFNAFKDPKQALHSCWTERAIGAFPRTMNAKELLMWRWICSTGVYHQLGNSFSLQALSSVADDPNMTAHKLMCREPGFSNGDNHFLRCSAVYGLGIEDATVRLDFVRNGLCSEEVRQLKESGSQPQAWETVMLTSKKQMQLTCNSDRDFVTVNDHCPAAFDAHFMCLDHSADVQYCRDNWHVHCDNAGMRSHLFQCPGH